MRPRVENLRVSRMEKEKAPKTGDEEIPKERESRLGGREGSRCETRRAA